ncbi:uncharacterized protein LOC114951539 [Acropora millepora]|uniref:uncharacterized protein LOC114951539 n=1 Tax=Acropora millepora TaxID=45264 RepID=UPI001CF3B0DE|nr:uncharacterized protein LOC114951539 [Acropora millepora]
MSYWILLLDYLSSFSSLKDQANMSAFRFIFSLVFFFVWILCDAIAGSGRLGFICHPKTSEFEKELCFLRYSADMNPLMRPYHFLLVTAFALVAFWTVMISYSSIHFRKIRRATDSSEREHLCQEFFKKFLLHVGSEAVVLSAVLGLFCFVQKIHFAETYICTLKIAPEMKCRDLHHQVKSIVNILFIGGLAFLLFLCIVTVCQAVCNKESFIKELLVLNSRENKAGTHVIWNDGVAQVPEVSSQDLTDDISLDWKKLGRQLGFSNAHLSNVDHENHCVREKVTAMLNVWRKRVGEVATAEVLGEALKQIERKDLLTKVMKSFTTGVVYLRGLFRWEVRPVTGNVRFLLFTIMILVLAILYDTVNNGRLDFRCHPEINDALMQECLSRYYAEMRSFIDPYFMVRITAVALFVLWSAINLYSTALLRKMRKKTIYGKERRLFHKIRKKFLLHLCCGAVVIAVSLALFCYAQKVYFSEDRYKCTLRNASVEIVVTCRDIHHWDKANLNIFIIGGMALILLLCIWAICYAICKKEEFIKDLVDFAKGNEEGREKIERWTREANVVVMECYYKSKMPGGSEYMPRMRELWIGRGMPDLRKDLLRRHALTILKNNLLRKDELKQIRDRVGFQEGKRQVHRVDCVIY